MRDEGGYRLVLPAWYGQWFFRRRGAELGVHRLRAAGKTLTLLVPERALQALREDIDFFIYGDGAGFLKGHDCRIKLAMSVRQARMRLEAEGLMQPGPRR